MAYIDQANLATDATFQNRVRIAMVTAAVQIAAEAVANDADATVYAKRQVLANAVLLGINGPLLTTFCWAVVENAVITGTSPDSDIQFQVNSVWNAIAGVRATD